MMAAAVAMAAKDTATVSVCRNGEVTTRPLVSCAKGFLESADPFRKFRWYKYQKHYPGSYFSVTEGLFVGYESRLERACALLADFATGVHHVVSQPFLLQARVDGTVRRHIPDYLLFDDGGLTVVAVKPKFCLTDPKVISTFAWVRRAVETVGWRFEVFSEPNSTMFANVNFLAGYRRAESVSPTWIAELRSRNLVGSTFGDAVRVVCGPAPRVRAALLHRLWRQELCIDLRQPLSASTLLEVGIRS